MRSMQEKQNELTSQYNLFTNQPAVFTKTMKLPQPQKTQIQIVFQHPNLLYLSDKRVKTKQEISQQVEKRLLNLIKNRFENKAKFKNNSRPATSYFSYLQNQTEQETRQQPFRCMTSAESKRTRQRRRKMQMQSYSNAYPLQEGIFAMEKQNLIDIENKQKVKSCNKSCLKKQKLSSEPKLNMYIEMQRRIFNYNNRTRKSNVKKVRNMTLQQF